MVGVILKDLLGPGDLDLFEHGEGRLVHVAPAQIGVKPQGFTDLLLDGVHGVQRRHGLLKDHGDVLAAQLAQRRGGEGGDVHLPAVALLKADGALTAHSQRKGEQSHDRGAGNALAAAGLAHHAEVLPFADGEIHALHQLDGGLPLPPGELNGKIAYFQ